MAGLRESVQSKCSLDQVKTILDSKADLTLVQQMLVNKVSTEDFHSHRNDLNKAVAEVHNKATKQDVLQLHEAVTKSLEQVQKELLLKCSIKDACHLLD